MSVQALGGVVQGYFQPNMIGTFITVSMTGLVRIPALAANALALLVFAELSTRGLTRAVNLTPLKIDTTSENWASRIFKRICPISIQPFQEKYQLNAKGEKTLDKDGNPIILENSSKSLLVALVSLTIVSLVATEFVRLGGGEPPKIYNLVTPFFGPLRVGSESNIEGIRNVLKQLNLL